MICRWVKEYIAAGEGAFTPKGQSGHPFAALYVSKSLSELKRLRLMAAKFEIENERSKKDTGWKELIQTRNILPAIRIECSESMLSRFISGKTDKLDDESTGRDMGGRGAIQSIAISIHSSHTGRDKTDLTAEETAQ